MPTGSGGHPSSHNLCLAKRGTACSAFVRIDEKFVGAVSNREGRSRKTRKIVVENHSHQAAASICLKSKGVEG